MAVIQTEIKKEGKDEMTTRVAGKINGLYYYYLEPGLFTTITYDDGSPVKPGTKLPDNTSILGTTDAICNVAYVPFMSVTAKDLTRVPYDSERFGKINRDESPETSNSANFPFVFRLRPTNPLGRMEISSTSLYPKGKAIPSPTSPRDYKNESRLLDYPYRTIMFTSNVFDPFEIIPHYTTEIERNNNVVKLYAQCAINPGGNFFLSVPGYKGDSADFTERQYSTTSVDIPNTSNAYANYMSTQKATAQNNVWKPVSDSMASSIPSVAAATLAGGPIAGAATGAASVVAGYAQSISAKTSLLAKEKDLITTPNSLKSTGGDILCKLGIQKEAYSIAYERTIHDEYKRIIGDFLATYGYKQNKVMKPKLRSRYHYNYIKTIGCNLKGNGVPKKHLAILRSIFDKGVTLWHVDRHGVTISDYSKDNTEMKFI